MGRVENEIEHGRRIARRAEDVWGWSTVAGARRLERRADLMIQFGRFKAEDRLLEIGCGTGACTEKIYARTQARILAVDISEELLAIARGRLPEVSFRTENAMRLSLDAGCFDGIYGNSTLHHLEMEPALREMYRVMKNGGRLVFAEPNLLNPQIFVQKNVPWVKQYLGDSPDETAVVRWRLARLLTSIGFRNIHILPFDFLHPRTPSALVGAVERLGQILEGMRLVREIAGSVLIYAEK